MYLPTATTFLHLLQLPLFLSNAIRRFGVDDGQSGGKDLNHLANISPYHTAPAVFGVSPELPGDCSVDRVVLLHRHGSRGPEGEEKYIKMLVAKLAAAQEKIDAADLPPELLFLKAGYQSHLVAQNLTIIGRQQMFNHGVEFALRYPKLSTDVITTTITPRVVESAHFFAEGFFGLDPAVEFLIVEDVVGDDEVSWLDPYKYCRKLPRSAASAASKKWGSEYASRIAKRLNDLLPDVGLDNHDIRGALNACPYELAARNTSPWCNVFSADELREFEYDIDLYLNICTEHDAPRGGPGSLAGAIYVKKLIDRLNDQSPTTKSLYLDFGHDHSILFALTALGLNKDAQPLTPHKVVPDRKFKSTNLTPFAANMVWEKFTCKDSFNGPQVRLLLNGVTLPLMTCGKTKQDWMYGTCSLGAFEAANQFSMNVEYESEQWERTCGYPKAPHA